MPCHPGVFWGAKNAQHIYIYTYTLYRAIWGGFLAFFGKQICKCFICFFFFFGGGGVVYITLKELDDQIMGFYPQQQPLMWKKETTYGLETLLS